MRSFTQHTITEAFTKQHYIAIADVISDALASVEEATKGDPKAVGAVEDVAKKLATIFQNDNRLFDKGRFLTACGL